MSGENGDPEIRIAGKEVRVVDGPRTLMASSLRVALGSLSQAHDLRKSCEILPRDVRIWIERRDAVAVALEIPPHARTVQWLDDNSEQPFGPGSSYHKHLLGFPYIILLMVFRSRMPTNYQQLYYRNAPLSAEDQGLLLPNLYNVAKGYGQRCWVCLANLEWKPDLSWNDSLERITEHVLSGAYNRSSEHHEGNSYWSSAQKRDPRVSSVETWEEATRRNRCFALDVDWEQAGTTALDELNGMLDRVIAPIPDDPSATDLVGWLTRRHPRPRRKKGST